jgi:hypothetical protein
MAPSPSGESRPFFRNENSDHSLSGSSNFVQPRIFRCHKAALRKGQQSTLSGYSKSQKAEPQRLNSAGNKQLSFFSVRWNDGLVGVLLLPCTLINSPMSIMLGFSDGEILGRKWSFSKLMEFSPKRIGPMPSPPPLIRMDREIDALVLAVVNAHKVLQ